MAIDGISQAEIGQKTPVTETRTTITPKGLETYKIPPFNIDSFKARLAELTIGTSEDLVNKSATTENLLGSGGNASVFSIPNVEGLVLRVPNGRFGADTSIAPLETVPDRFPDLNLGQAVAKLGGSTILKEQTGIPAGVPYGEVRRNPEVGVPAYQHVLELAAQMPQEAYDNLASLFEFLNENRLNFDPSKANNLLIDQPHQKFNVVDLFNTAEGHEPDNGFHYMAIVLMDNAYAGNVDNPQLEEEFINLRKTILLKSFEACKKANLPIPRLDDSSLQYSFKLAGMEDQWPAYRQQLIPGSSQTAS